jgi:hypothetical protein
MFARARTKVTLKIKGLRGPAGAARLGVTGQHLSMVRASQRRSSRGRGKKALGGTNGKRRSGEGPVEFVNAPERNKCY